MLGLSLISIGLNSLISISSCTAFAEFLPIHESRIHCWHCMQGRASKFWVTCNGRNCSETVKYCNTHCQCRQKQLPSLSLGKSSNSKSPNKSPKMDFPTYNGRRFCLTLSEASFSSQNQTVASSLQNCSTQTSLLTTKMWPWRTAISQKGQQK